MSDAAKRKPVLGSPLPPAHGNPFGTLVPLRDPRHSVTLADAVRRTRWIAIDISADRFSLFVLTQSGKRRGLSPCFDSDYPKTSPETRLISIQLGEELAKRVVESTAPLWWSDPAIPDALASLNWPKRIAPSPPGMTAVAFPVFSDRGPSGLAMFSGPAIVLSGEALCETHARCFALFDAVTRIATADNSSFPIVSKREAECLRLAADGHTSEVIAQLLGLSVHTANQYLANVTRKLNAVNRMQAVAKALRLGLID